MTKLTGKCESIGLDPEALDGIGSLDGDTTLSHGSFAAAMHAAGSVCEAVDMVARKKVGRVVYSLVLSLILCVHIFLPLSLFLIHAHMRKSHT